MDKAAIRSLTSQLADDFSWLEQHGRGQAGQEMQAGKLRLAASLVRNVLGPFLEDQPSEPLQLAVVGGAGAGKSTIANMLSGCVLAEANPQAGYTRHPIAYTSSNEQTPWAAHLGFLGPLKRLTAPTPANLDEDVYQVRRVPMTAGKFSLLEHFIIWDCPDVTTFAASNYATRVLEIAGLADVIVFVASDERYNDEVPTQFLKLFLQAGKSVIVCITKMKPADAPAFLDHFQKSVLGQAPVRPVACLPVPQMSYEQLADPAKGDPQYRVPLINQVSIFSSSAKNTRRRTAIAATGFLKHFHAELLGVASTDVQALDDWRSLVRQGQAEFLGRYRKDFLASERFPRFDEALVKLIELLEIPKVGKAIGMALRAPFNLMRGLFSKVMQRSEEPTIPERKTLEDAMNGWLDFLRKEAARRAGGSAAWAHINRGFADGMTRQIRGQFEQSLKNFQSGMTEEVERTARSIYEELEKNPVALNTLRGGKLTVEVMALTGTLVGTIAGGHVYISVFLAYLAAAVMNQLVELLGKQYVETQREVARSRQENLVSERMASPLAESLIDWPTSGGSDLERLAQILRRVPGSIKQLEPLIVQKLQEK